MKKTFLKLICRKRNKKTYILYVYRKNLFFLISNSRNYSLFFDFNSINLPISLSCRQLIKQNPRNIYGQFYIGPFFVGQGLTIANALRRTLLSELSSLAITSVQIQNIVHQYQTVQGLQESVFDFLLNLKNIVLKSKKIIKKSQIGYLQIQGPCIIKAKNLSLPPHIQCVDPEQYIATLSEDGSLNMKFIIRQGKHSLIHVTPGYDCSIEKNEKQEKIPTTIANSQLNDNNSINSLSLLNTYSKNLIIDPSFNPVIKVNYSIELLEFDEIGLKHSNLESKKQSELIKSNEKSKNLITQEIIILEVWTNGSISPIVALKFSIQKLISVFLNIQKSKLLNTKRKESEIFYRDIYDAFNKKSNILKYKQCQTLSDFKYSKIQHISVSEKFLIQKLQFLINQLESF
nr:RNA polymerase alpha subunit [Oedogonium crispum]